MKQQLIIPSHLKHLNEVEAFVQHLIEMFSIPDSMHGHFMLTVCESANNAICHGNKNDVNKEVIIEVTENEKDLIITIEDEGEGFNFNEIPDPTSRRYIRNERGRGIFLIKHLADEVKFLNKGSKIQIKFDLNREHQLLLRGD